MVADGTPLQYVPPVAFWALVLIVPLALVIVNLLAALPGRRAARRRIGENRLGAIGGSLEVTAPGSGATVRGVVPATPIGAGE